MSSSKRAASWEPPPKGEIFGALSDKQICGMVVVNNPTLLGQWLNFLGVHI